MWESLFTDSMSYETLEGDDVFETFESLSQSPSVHKRLPTKASHFVHLSSAGSR